MTATVERQRDDARAELHWREFHRRLCLQHPAFLLDFVKCVDSKTGERFSFDLLTAEERVLLLGEEERLYDRFGIAREPGEWHWQREELLEPWLRWDRWVGLKARQIGVTWLAGGLTLHALLFRPGTRCLIISTNEDEAKKVIARIWGMYLSTPLWLREHVVQTMPKRFGSEPSQEIEVRHPDGRKSAILALPSTKKAGHGETAAIVILDEGAYQDYLRDTWKATFPTIDGGGQILVISTGNGVSNAMTGEGNFFHYLWVNGDSMGLKKKFLRWDLHPKRDEDWYSENAAALPPIERAQQYPRDPEDAFLSTQPCWFDLDKLGWYAREAKLEPIVRLRFKRDPHNRRRMVGDQHDFGEVRVFTRPEATKRYAIGADVATGRGTDFSAAYVIDLTEMEFAAEFHAKISPDLFAEQLWAMGRWYNDAIIAVELGGGYGDSVIVPLRDGVKGLKKYPRLYRHSSEIRLEHQVNATFGFPMTNRTRPQVINQLEQVVRDREMKGMPEGLIAECRTFISMPTPPTPRAQEGANDDRVMAAGVALEMYRRYGYHQHAIRSGGSTRPSTKRWVGID